MKKFTTSDGTVFPVHTLANGTTVAITSNHDYNFSDGTNFLISEFDGAKTFNEALTVEDIDKEILIGTIPAVHTTKRLPEAAVNILRSFCKSDSIYLVLVPYQVVAALYDMEREGMTRRDYWRKVVAYNATPETRRSRPDEKIVDTRRWSY